MDHPELERLCEAGTNFYDRGYAFGSTGNLSVRFEGDVWITPTGCSLKGLVPDVLARIDLSGAPLNANVPSKEYPFHLAVYRLLVVAAVAISGWLYKKRKEQGE